MKRIIAMILALVCVLSLAACGGTEAPAATQAPAANAPAAPAATPAYLGGKFQMTGVKWNLPPR